ncbi:P1 family peptidase [Bacillus sp. FJAT-49736]|uniref:DmpA family aminopeptidase n=1 Tax=Bacillus sp. FJAT-49736 TaxID=2833582 RepID=UPI001BC94E84|nr:P1 family peptidase [Bacillus sp. FJAT-49736]MBS4172287.1 P1 family peptidase [Bacillus sp. FJAT-49736]
MKAREAGIKIGTLQTGTKNCITDVEGVRVGHITLREDISFEECIRTGVTVILPHSGNLFKEKVSAACYVANGFGKTTGLVQVEELGLIESPIVLTNTFCVGNAWNGSLQYMLHENPEIGDSTSSINIVVGECNDSYLNSARMLAVTPNQVMEAIKTASNHQVAEGAVGAGAGTMCFGYKGGIGCASRLIPFSDQKSYTVGVLVQSNFGKKDEFYFDIIKQDDNMERPDGSIMMILATDAPLSDRQLKRLSKRCTIGLGRIGSYMHHGSGDIVIAFSNANKYPHNNVEEKEHSSVLRDDHSVMNILFQAAAEATEEAILNSLLQAETTTGRKGRVAEKLPSVIIDALKK